jgi:hypothetical protein
LETGDAADLGVTHEDDVAQIRDGGRFDLTPWRKNPVKRLLMQSTLSPREILYDASHVAGHLYLQLDPGAGPAGAGEISATYNPLSTTTMRTVHVEPSV